MSSQNSPGLPYWDLSNVYPGLDSEPFALAVSRLKEQLVDLDSYMAPQKIDGPSLSSADPAFIAKFIDGYLERMNAILRLYRTLQNYVYAYVATDSYDDRAKRTYSELEALGVRWYQHSIRFQSWIGAIAGILPQALAHSGLAQAHAFYLQELADQSRYLMSQHEESLAAELALSGAKAWNKLHGTVSSQLVVSFEQDGEVKRLPIAALQNLRFDLDEDLRRRAYETELAAWESVREPLAAALNGVKGAVITLDKRRGRADALHAALDKSRIDSATLETMLGVMEEAFPVFRRYLKSKAERLGKEDLAWWDLYAPVGQIARRFTFPEASDFVVAQFGTFSERLADFAQRAFDNHWIDAEPRDGKRGGAFCMRLPGVDETRILCNFDGSLDQVFTLAHELGHGYHSQRLIGKSMLQQITPMTLAETASTFCETIVTDALLASAASAYEELAILETFLSGATQIIVDITARFLFEKEIFERRADAELSADDFCDIMLRAQQATYGDGLDQRYLHPYVWAWKPHFYRPNLSFYNYPYAFGLLFGLGLYAIYQERGHEFTDEYDTLLGSTGEGTVAALASRFGIDVRQPEFWRGSMQLIEARVLRYLEL